jgi:phage shock protein A
MHEHHGHHHHGHSHDAQEVEALHKLKAMLDHWIEHGDSHIESYREWAEQATAAGEEEVAREIHLAIAGSESIRGHLKRARDIAAAKLVLKK